MTSREIRKIFLEFFARHGHKIISSSTLVPADPTALFTSAGMQQFGSYLAGEAEPPYRRATSCQKCFRTSDIDRVGDEFHHTFFEMLGNWSFGDYFKEEAIKFALELLNSKFQIPNSKLWVTIFKGQGSVPKDNESIKIWQKNGIPRGKIKEFGMEDNFWGPVGLTGPCGPNSEIHFDRGIEFQKGKCSLRGCGPNCTCGRFVEVWNLVFMEYNRTAKGRYVKLPAQNVDTGAGLERLACILQNKASDYETDLFLPLIEEIKKLSNQKTFSEQKSSRIIADHIRGACFLIVDGVLPGKEDRGYVLRRIIRRAMRYGRLFEMDKNFLIPLAQLVINQYKDVYPEVESKRNDILTVIQKEQEKFTQTLNHGLKEFQKLVQATLEKKKKTLDSKTVFHLYDTYGFPFELTKELAREKNFKVDEKAFQREFNHHKEISRAGVKKKFGGVGIQEIKNQKSKIKIIRLHTATHLLQQALRNVLGEHVRQAGSDINLERLRFDFTHPQKLSDKEIKKVEEIVNQKIKENLEVKMEQMPYEQAIKAGTLAFFREKYPKVVKVFSIGNFSKEICAGPHVGRTGEIGEFKIISEKSSGSGIRRIKAIVEK